SPAQARTQVPVPLVIRAQRQGPCLATRRTPHPARFHFPRELPRDSYPSHRPRLQAFAPHRLPSNFRPRSIAAVIANPCAPVRVNANLNPYAALHLDPDVHLKANLHLTVHLNSNLYLNVHLTVRLKLNLNSNVNYKNRSRLNPSPDLRLSSEPANQPDRPASHPFSF